MENNYSETPPGTLKEVFKAVLDEKPWKFWKVFGKNQQNAALGHEIIIFWTFLWFDRTKICRKIRGFRIRYQKYTFPSKNDLKTQFWGCFFTFWGHFLGKPFLGHWWGAKDLFKIRPLRSRRGRWNRRGDEVVKFCSVTGHNWWEVARDKLA